MLKAHDFIMIIEEYNCGFNGTVDKNTGEIDGVIETDEKYNEAEIRYILREAGFKGSVEAFKDPEETADILTFKIKGELTEVYDARFLAEMTAWLNNECEKELGLNSNPTKDSIKE